MADSVEEPAPGSPSTLTADHGLSPEPAVFSEAWASDAERYTFVHELGRGGGGAIEVAVDRKLGRRVAIKRPLDPAGSIRLEREALVMALLEHPSIAPIHDAGRRDDGAPFYAMK